jgi:glyoxylase-like metal-dependent hydrolase (beta-lactamase superfamily II)
MADPLSWITMSNDSSRTPSPAPAEEHWGRLYVNRRCCGAATCRNLAPELLGEVLPRHAQQDDGGAPREGAPRVLPDSHDPGAFTGVLRQPRNKEEFLAARTAAAACAFNAIRLEQPTARLTAEELGTPWRGWPRRIEDNVWSIGHPSEKSAGALTYFIELPGGGVLVDPPKPSEELFRWLEEHGGVRWLLLTHWDHVNHHAEIAARFPGCRRIIGAPDVKTRETAFTPSTSEVELKLEVGQSPMTLEGTPIAEDALASAELVLLPQPGHTPGSLCLLYRGRYLFSGDHLCYSRLLGHLTALRLQCWDDWGRQCASVRRMVEWANAGWLRFTWLLPGHGEWHRFGDDSDPKATAAVLQQGLDWMERQPPGQTPMSKYLPFIMTRLRPELGISRVVRAIGGEGGEAWVLPSGSRRYVNDHDPARTQAAHRRGYALAAGALVAVTSLLWLGARAIGSLLAGP